MEGQQNHYFGPSTTYPKHPPTKPRPVPLLFFLQGQQNLYFGVSKVAVWMLNGLYQSLVCFVFVYLLYRIWPERRNGHMVGLFGAGTALYTVVVICVNCQIAVVSSAFFGFWANRYSTSPFFLLRYCLPAEPHLAGTTG